LTRQLNRIKDGNFDEIKGAEGAKEVDEIIKNFDKNKKRRVNSCTMKLRQIKKGIYSHVPKNRKII